MIEIKRAMYEDMEQIIAIIEEAKEHLKENNIDQWQNNYPNKNTIAQDIMMNEAYIVYLDEIAFAYFMLSYQKESSYDEVIEGAWSNNEDYAVIHRLAIAKKFRGKGLASKIFEMIEEEVSLNCKQIRIDTHKENLAMKTLLTNRDYSYVGEIRLKDKSLRDAYEKILANDHSK